MHPQLAISDTSRGISRVFVAITTCRGDPLTSPVIRPSLLLSLWLQFYLITSGVVAVDCSRKLFYPHCTRNIFVVFFRNMWNSLPASVDFARLTLVIRSLKRVDLSAC